MTDFIINRELSVNDQMSEISNLLKNDGLDNNSIEIILSKTSENISYYENNEDIHDYTKAISVFESLSEIKKYFKS